MNTTEILKQLNEGFDHTLPSGLTVKLRRLQFKHYTRNGTVPSHLQALVSFFLDNHTLQETFDAHENETKAFFDWVICETLVEPSVAIEPESPDVLPLDYLPEPDKANIFATAFTPIQEMIEQLRPLSKPGKGKRSSSSTRSPRATESGPAN